MPGIPSRFKALLGHLDHRPSQALALGPDPREARPHPLLDAAPLELGDGGQDVELESPRRRGGVDALRQADEGHPERLQFVYQENQVPEVATEPVQPPDDESVELPPLGSGNQLVEGRAPVLRARHSPVNVFRGSPTPPAAVVAKLAQLVLRFLVPLAHASVERRSHDCSPSGEPS